MSRIKIDYVTPFSIAAELGIIPGEYLISVNSKSIKDIFDYRLSLSEEQILIEIEKFGGDIVEYEIEKDQYEELGLEFENDLIEETTRCSNFCIFCFIDQLPTGMRETLYFKDDDSRLSFLTGNYVTLTNITDDELNRIIGYRLSPINVSVHTVNSDLRVKMLRNKNAGNVLPRIKMLTDAGIEVNTQIVLCKGVNDNDELKRSIEVLGGFYPKLKSISVVPVGITKHRQKLFHLESFDKKDSEQVVDLVSKYQKDFYEKYGSRIVYLADEFYLNAEIDLPPYEDYEDFPQIENGVGLIADLKYEFYEYFKELSEKVEAIRLDSPRVVNIATGVSAYKTILELSNKLEEVFEGLKINVFAISNEFFGPKVTVTGLLTGSDIVNTIKNKEKADALLICKCMLKANSDLFLDDYTVKRLEDELEMPVIVVENTGYDLIDNILGINNLK